jgi:hypothetical protein
MTLANQPDSLPSNKVVVMAALTVLTYHFGGGLIPYEVMEAYGVLISVALALVAAYIIPDRANVPKE